MVFCVTGITCWTMLELEIREKEKWVKSHEKAEASNKITSSRQRVTGLCLVKIVIKQIVSPPLLCFTQVLSYMTKEKSCNLLNTVHWAPTSNDLNHFYETIHWALFRV